MTLRELKIGESAVVTQLGGEGALRQHFLDMGMIPGAEVTVQKMAPMGDPMELKIHGYELTLRLADAEKIQVEKISEKREHPLPEKKHFKREHPVKMATIAPTIAHFMRIRAPNAATAAPLTGIRK